jgi:hypothetical protein
MVWTAMPRTFSSSFGEWSLGQEMVRLRKLVGIEKRDVVGKRRWAEKGCSWTCAVVLWRGLIARINDRVAEGDLV